MRSVPPEFGAASKAGGVSGGCGARALERMASDLRQVAATGRSVKRQQQDRSIGFVGAIGPPLLSNASDGRMCPMALWSSCLAQGSCLITAAAMGLPLEQVRFEFGDSTLPVAPIRAAPRTF